MNLYEILGVPRTATRDEITAAYKRLVLQFHPNVTAGDCSKFIELAHAFRILKDEKQRFHYDMLGEKALTYLNDNRFGEIIVNLYDRTNVVMFIYAAFFLLAFLFTFPYLLLLNHRAYSAVFLPFYVSVVLALIPLWRMSRFFGKNSQYQNERSVFAFASLKFLFFSLQVLAITLYYDLPWNEPIVHVLPTFLRESVDLFYAFSTVLPSQRTWRRTARLMLQFLVSMVLVYGLVSNIPFALRCCIPSACVFHWWISKNMHVSVMFAALAPVFLLSLGVGLFIARKVLLLGFISLAVFDTLLIVGLSVALIAYKSIPLHPDRSRSLVHI